jgi:hypothetical protein
MNATIIQAIVRHILTAVAGGFFMKYGVDGATQDVIIGGISAVAGLGWSVYDKRRNTNDLM